MITVFTPTFNRANLLPKLFNSLQNQDCLNFIWLIVDDGSTDNTEDIVNNFKLESKFEIIYKYQKNEGKHVAFNTALDIFSTDYLMTIDSDDFFFKDAISKVYQKIYQIHNDLEIIGIAFPLVMKENKLNMHHDFNSEIIINPIKFTYENGIYSEFIFVYKRIVLENFRYPKFRDEKFILESIFTNRINIELQILYTPDSIAFGEYMNDGITVNRKDILISNPKGSSLAYLEKANNKNIPLYIRKIFVNNYWDYETIHNSSFKSKIFKIKSNYLKLYLIISKFKKNVKFLIKEYS